VKKRLPHALYMYIQVFQFECTTIARIKILEDHSLIVEEMKKSKRKHVNIICIEKLDVEVVCQYNLSIQLLSSREM
jgi:hypothetical protein